MPIFIQLNLNGDESELMVEIYKISSILKFHDDNGDTGSVVQLSDGTAYKVTQKPDEILKVMVNAYQTMVVWEQSLLKTLHPDT